MINIACNDLGTNIDVPFIAIDKINLNTLGKVRRSIRGKTFFNRVGKDHIYNCISAVYSNDDIEKLKDMDNLVITTTGNLEGGFNFDDKTAGLRLEKLKIGDFSLANSWWHVTFNLIDYAIV